MKKQVKNTKKTAETIKGGKTTHLNGCRKAVKVATTKTSRETPKTAPKKTGKVVLKKTAPKTTQKRTQANKKRSRRDVLIIVR